MKILRIIQVSADGVAVVVPRGDAEQQLSTSPSRGERETRSAAVELEELRARLQRQHEQKSRAGRRRGQSAQSTAREFMPH